MLGGEWTVEDLTGRGDLPEPAEDGATFSANSAIKALAASAVYPDDWVLADDSGLEVDVLEGAPGVHSARYGGPGSTDADNRRRLATELRQAAGEAWQSPQPARFRCVMTVARSGKALAQFDGVIAGHVVHPAQGEGGFGYDPVFAPTGYEQTFGVLPAKVKNRLSHRGIALARAVAWLEEFGG